MEDRVLAVQRMQDYIEEHFSESISLGDLARVSFYSPWYSYRLFVYYTGITPKDYIRRLRLSKSAIRLRDENSKIVDVALDLGFGSVDGYQRAFFREFSCNPKEYAKNPIPLYLFTPFGVMYREIRKEKVMEKTKSIFVQEIVKPARKVLIKRGIKAKDYFEYCEEAGCDVWGLLLSIKSISNEPVSMYLTKDYVLPNTSVYVQGVEVSLDYDGIVPDGFDVLFLPETRYLMFKGESFEEEDYCFAIDEVRKAIECYDPSIIGASWDRQMPRIQLEPKGERGYIELVAIK